MWSSDEAGQEDSPMFFNKEVNLSGQTTLGIAKIYLRR